MKSVGDILIIIYWIIGYVLGWIFVPDLIASFNLPDTMKTIWIPILSFSFVGLNQIPLWWAAETGKYNLTWGSLVVFPGVNCICETLIFASSFRLGHIISGDIIAFIIFTIYCGIIHVLFWNKLMPILFKSDYLSYLLIFLSGIGAIGFSLIWGYCFLLKDIYSVVIFHISVDLMFTFKARPTIFAHCPCTDLTFPHNKQLMNLQIKYIVMK